MNGLLPLFPLDIVIFPGEKLNLHIFEERYIQLVNDVMASDGVFGMPAYINQSIEYGSLLKIEEISKIHDDGKMDIKTTGKEVFRVLNFYNPTYGKLYAAGKVELITNIDDPDFILKEQIKEQLKKLLDYINVGKKLDLDSDFGTYDLAHIVGLSKESKYKILTLNSEKERQLFMLDHLEKILPMLENIEETKKRINMNGHFKNFGPLEF